MIESDDDPALGSVSEWLQNLKRGERSAVDKIWDRYFSRMVDFARRRMESRARAASDEEDFAIVAFTQFVEGAQNGKFYKLEDRSDLWQILAMITSRRIKNASRKRGSGGEVLSASTVMGDDQSLESFLEMPSRTVIDGLNNDCNELLETLPERNREFAQKRLMGYTNSEIANWFNVSLSTVERAMASIRETWTKELELEP